MMIIIRLIISTHLNSGRKRPSRSHGTISLAAPHFVASFVRPFSLSPTYISGFPPAARFHLQEIPLDLVTRTYSAQPASYTAPSTTMDVANLISPPGPDPIMKSRPTYKSAGDDDKSYFTAVPAFYSRSPQPPLSPPVEDQPKCSLPSISTLFQGADSAAAQPASMSISYHMHRKE